MKKNSNLSLRSRIKSFTHAFEGLKTLWSHEPNFKIHFLALILVSLMSYLLKISKTEWLILIVVMSIVLITEAINTSLEYLADGVSKDFNIDIKKAKDVAAAAVVLSAINAIVIGLIMFLPKLLALLMS